VGGDRFTWTLRLGLRQIPRVHAPALTLAIALSSIAPDPDRVRATANPAPDTAITTVFLVRHAEKDTTLLGHDVPLSAAGMLRARELRHLLGDERLDAIYVTPYLRNRQTAQPLADRLGDSLSVVDSPQETVRRIRELHRGHRVLVVGHSNTLPAIFEELTGTAMPAFRESEWDRFYVVTLVPGRAAQVVALRYGAPGRAP
jgi:broad specificity phosphatase PhoE